MNLPKGYIYELPPTDKRGLIPGEALYGGADISEVSDAKGNKYIACCCRKEAEQDPDKAFGFRIFRNDLEEVPYEPFCHQRGELGYDLFSGKLTWIAWDGAEYFRGDIESAASFASYATLTGQASAAIKLARALRGALIEVAEKIAEIVNALPKV